jgi:Ca-activated chloride channel family protein
MRTRTFAVLASVSMALSGAASWALSAPSPASRNGIAITTTASTLPPAASGARFVDGKTLLLEGRLGRATVARSNQTGSETTESLVLASITGADVPADAPTRRPPVHLAIVVDRSGSMAGVKMHNAVLAAVGAIDRMNDGDRVTVVAFDTTARVIAPTTVLDPTTRPRVQAAVRSMQPGGDTCISCGLEAAFAQLEAAPGGSDEVDRVLLISDGEATTGVKDVAGLRAMASRMSTRGFSVSTIGVDIDFDAKVMAAIAQESNGKHWFVPDASALAGVFQEELGALQTAVATGAELAIEPAPGVVIQDVFDRPFRREGNRVVVQLGTFDPRQEKTVLLRTRVPSDADGSQPVASFSLTYRDVRQRLDARCGGSLEVDVRSDGTAQQDLDPFVAARFERSLTAHTLTEANDLFEHGKGDEARRKLEDRHAALARAAAPAVAATATAAPLALGQRTVASDFEGQVAALEQAQAGFAPPPPAANAGGGMVSRGAAAATPAAAPAAKATVRQNQANASDMAF